MQNGKCYFQAKNPIKIDILVITYLQDDYTYNVSYKYVLNMHDTEQNFPYKKKIKKEKKVTKSNPRCKRFQIESYIFLRTESLSKENSRKFQIWLTRQCMELDLDRIRLISRKFNMKRRPKHIFIVFFLR